MVSFPGALPEERQSRAFLFNSPRVGSLSSSSNSGRRLRLGLRLLLHSLWGITLGSAAPSVPTASPDLG